jgi:hypothetical protein
MLEVLRSRDNDADMVEYAIKRIKYMEAINHDIDILFCGWKIAHDFDVLDRNPNDVPYAEIESRLHWIRSISDVLAPQNGIALGDSGNSLAQQGDEVERVLLQCLGNLEKADADGCGWQARLRLKKLDRIRVTDGPFENCEGIVDEILLEKGVARVNLTVFGRTRSVEVEFWQIAVLAAT